MAFRKAMYLNGKSVQDEFCLIGTYQDKEYPTQAEYRGYLREQLSALDHLPDVFICANDFIAIDTLVVLKELGISVPDDVQVCGFDDSPESQIMSPTLTTIHSQIMGYSAVQLMMSRIGNPKMNCRTIYVETDLIYRESAPL